MVATLFTSRFRCLICGLIFAFTFSFISPQQRSTPLNMQSKPIYGTIKLVLKAKSVIGQTTAGESLVGSDIRDAAVDVAGNIYVLQKNSLLIFGSDGKLQKEIHSADNGSSGFTRLSKMYIDDGGDLFFEDLNKIYHYEKKGEVRSCFKVGEMLAGDFIFFMPSTLFGVTYGCMKDIIKIQVVGWRASMTKGDIVLSFPDTEVQSSGGVMGGITHSYSQKILMCPLLHNRFCAANNIEYEIYVCGLGGKVLSRFSRSISKRELSLKEKEIIKNLSRQAVVPPYQPPLEKILSDEKGRIYCVLKKSLIDDNPNRYLVDVFNDRGVYLYCFESPGLPMQIRSGDLLTIEKKPDNRVGVNYSQILNYDSMKSSLHK